jgi:hypothetical protein
MKRIAASEPGAILRKKLSAIELTSCTDKKQLLHPNAWLKTNAW